MTKKNKSKSKPFSWNKLFSAKGAKKRWWIGVGVLGLLVAGACCFHGYRTHQLYKTADQLTQLVTPIGGLQVQVVGRSVFLAGEVDNIEAFTKARSIAQSLQESCSSVKVSNLSRLSDGAKLALAREIKKSIRDRRIRVRVVEERFVLEGTVRNDYDAERAVELARSALMFDKFPGRPVASEGAAPTSNDYFAPSILDMIKIQGS